MNATPVWGLNLPGWDGKLPAPPLPKIVGRKLFDTIRDDDTIEWYLNEAYVHREAFDGTFSDSFQDYETSDQDELLITRSEQHWVIRLKHVQKIMEDMQHSRLYYGPHLHPSQPRKKRSALNHQHQRIFIAPLVNFR